MDNNGNGNESSKRTNEPSTQITEEHENANTTQGRMKTNHIQYISPKTNPCRIVDSSRCPISQQLT